LGRPILTPVPGAPKVDILVVWFVFFWVDLRSGPSFDWVGGE